MTTSEFDSKINSCVGSDVVCWYLGNEFKCLIDSEAVSGLSEMKIRLPMWSNTNFVVGTLIGCDRIGMSFVEQVAEDDLKIREVAESLDGTVVIYFQ